MTRTELERLVADAEGQPRLRHHLSHCRSWQDLLQAAQRLGYAVQPGDLGQAIREAHASAFLERSRLWPIPDLWLGMPAVQPRLRRSASTAR
ncbi:Nif11 family protein [Vulcanococcus limneticus Candia 3F8]|uniref:Nif11 family protein n=1 Tax=Vulcanococcus limneticus TaxID=2170428 RepID=UPI000B9803C7|nr:Nif11 family protein [Vulcanococcus limneticus]MCP9790612.1 Nif11 family protein [Vulcanococcus limneticus MW73D5]MCP9892691.1 Nif11 family protein [Vulcanococcus limneticus Candia 3F8]MCP9896219.1 Nif11 family protein [Vulcanococcus limneticus Candia 3B3]